MAKRLSLLLVVVVLLLGSACQPVTAPAAVQAVSDATRPAPSDAGAGSDALALLPSVESVSSTAATTATPPPVKGGQVVVGAVGHVDGFNPLLAESEASRALTPLLFDSLLTYDPDSGQLKPHLARSWTVASDSRSITFTLRTDARWHDGRTVVADDVLFTLESVRDPQLDSLYGARLGHVIAVSAPGDDTVVVSLDAPHCPTVATLGEVPIIPRHLTDGDVITASLTEASEQVIGSGPFVLAAKTPDGEARLVANDGYWGGVPYLDTLVYRPFEDIAGLRQALREGEIDVAWMPAGTLSFAGRPSPDPGPDLAEYRYPALEFLFVAFNNEHPVLSDSQVRRALSMAVDRQRVLSLALEGEGELIGGSLPPWHWSGDPDLPPLSYDPDGARRLMEAAGWNDSDGDGWLDREGERLRLPVRTNGGNRLRERVATLVVGYYRAIGVDASVEFVQWQVLVDDLFTHDFEAVVFSWPLSAEPDQSHMWLSTENQTGVGYNFVSFADEEVDRLLQQALVVPGCADEDRAGLYRQVQDRLAQKRPYDFLLVPSGHVIASDRVGGIRPGPFASPFWNAGDWYVY
jgi:peptide/nickel transport system substrate-binding protein